MEMDRSPILRTVLWIAAGLLLLTISLFGRAMQAESAKKSVRTGPPEQEVMHQLLERYRNISYDQLRDERYEKRPYVEALDFDPTEAKYFERIRSKLKLTADELAVYRRNGFVSIDHEQRYSFGSAYHQIYAADLPVLITTDSVLHALHQSFDSMLNQLETSYLLPILS